MKIVKFLSAYFVILACASGLRAAESDIPKGYDPVTLFMIDDSKPLDLQQQRERYLLAKLLMPDISEDSLMVMPMSRAEAWEAGVKEVYYDYVSELADAFNKEMKSLKPEIRRACVEQHRSMRNRLESLISLQYINFDKQFDIVDGLTPEIAREIGFSNEAFVQIKWENRRVIDAYNNLLKSYSRHVDINANINQIIAESFGFYRSLFLEPNVQLPDGGNYFSRNLERGLRQINRKYAAK